MTDNSSESDRLDSIVAEYLKAIDAGQRAPTPEELRARHPEFAEELIAFVRDEVGPSFDGFECLEELGRGAIGVVYRARDVNLDREVAIKILREEYVLDRDWCARFRREGRLLAALSHPNVVVIHAVGDRGHFLVMELIPGPTLAERLRAGPLPVNQAISIARQIAEALEAAHAQGIVHRDLKPGNVKITPDGRVKVLDFGLARKTGLDGDAACSTGTGEGAIVGTAAYMSPEQARGERLDRRADIWAFGCVLFEMLASTRAFPGRTVTECLAAVLKGEPDWTLLPPDFDPRLLALIRRCLCKNVGRRLHDIADARIELEEIVMSPPPTAVATARVEWHGELLLGRPAAVFQPAVSADDRWLAYIQIEDRLGQVGVMNLSTGHRRLLTADRDQGSAFHPCWSPDHSWIYFARADSTPRGVFRVSVTDGHVEPVLDNADSPQPLVDGSMLAGRIGADGQYRIVRFWAHSNRLDTLAPPVVHLYDELNNFPSFRSFPDGKSVAFWRRPPGEAPRLFVLDLETGDGRCLDPAVRMGGLASGLAVMPDGKGVYVAHRPDGRHALRIVAVPIHPAHPTRTVLTIPGGASGLTVDQQGSLYVSVTQPFSELLRFPRNAAPGTCPERLTQGGVDWEVPTALPDGRILFGETAAGRHRVVTVKDGRRDKPFVLTDEDTWLPAAVLDDRRAAIGIGTGLGRDIAIVEFKTGRIVHRRRVGLGELTSLAACPDGTLFFAVRDTIYALGKDDHDPRPIAACGSAAIGRDGSFLLAVCPAADGPCLRRIRLNGGEPVDVLLRGGGRLHHLPIAGDAVGIDGRALVLTMPGDSYFNEIALVDPQTGEIERFDLDYDGDLFAPTHGLEGAVLAVGRPFQSEIWRFRLGS